MMAAQPVMDFSKPGRSPIGHGKTPPPPVTSPPPPPLYSPKLSSTDDEAGPPPPVHKRQPLSSSSPNATGRSQSALSSSTSYTGNQAPRERRSSYETGDDAYMRKPAQESESESWEQRKENESEPSWRSSGPPPITQSIAYRQRLTTEAPEVLQQPQSAVISSMNSSAPNSRHTSGGSFSSPLAVEEGSEPLRYHHHPFENNDRRHSAGSPPLQNHTRHSSEGHGPIPLSQRLAPKGNTLLGPNLSRPMSAYSSSSELGVPGRSSPGHYVRTPSPSRNSPDSRPMSYIDLLNVPYPQPPPAPSSLDNAHLRSAVGQNASLLSTKKTLEMYRANVKKTNDPTIQYEFAVFMISAAQELVASGQDDANQRQLSPKPGKDGEGSHRDNTTPTASSAEMFREARQILQKLSDRSYPFAQYYLADGYASGLFNKGVEDNDRAFPLFVAASKHGHAEAGYRAALCYEFGWGCGKNAPKAVQFYRQSASKNHPGAMARLGRACLVGDMGLGNRYREGLKWLKRAAESADFQYNAAPYELGLLHESGYGDDIFKDESYAAQLFTQSADLGHVEANYRLGDSYEHGKLSCPKDPALSVHFYTGAAQRGHPLAMMALCAWYMVGAEPVLEKDENEAYEWARKAAETGATYPFLTFPLRMPLLLQRDPC